MSAAPTTSATERARAAWGGGLPDWVIALAEACDAPGASQAKVAARLGYTPPVVSQLLNARYKGDLTRAERVVRGAYLAETVPCPVLGDLPVNDCLSHQRADFDGANHIRVSLYRACRGGCPHAQQAEDAR